MKKETNVDDKEKMVVTDLSSKTIAAVAATAIFPRRTARTTAAATFIHHKVPPTNCHKTTRKWTTVKIVILTLAITSCLLLETRCEEIYVDQVGNFVSKQQQEEEKQQEIKPKRQPKRQPKQQQKKNKRPITSKQQQQQQHDDDTVLELSSSSVSADDEDDETQSSHETNDERKKKSGSSDSSRQDDDDDEEDCECPWSSSQSLSALMEQYLDCCCADHVELSTQDLLAENKRLQIELDELRQQHAILQIQNQEFKDRINRASLAEKWSKEGVTQKMTGRLLVVLGNNNETITTGQRLLADTDQYMNEVVFFNPMYESVRADCRNHHELCTAWAAAGECDTNQHYMIRHCAPVCQTCDRLLPDSIRCPPPSRELGIWQPGSLDMTMKRMVSVVPLLARTLDGTDATKMKRMVSVVPLLQTAQHYFPIIRNHPKPWIVSLEQFLSEADCERLLLKAKAAFRNQDEKEATAAAAAARRKTTKSGGTTTTKTASKKSDDENNNNTTTTSVSFVSCQENTEIPECDVRPTGVSLKLQKRISNLTGIPISHAEHLKFMRVRGYTTTTMDTENGQQQQPQQQAKDSLLTINPFVQHHQHDFVTVHARQPCGPRIVTVFLFLNDEHTMHDDDEEDEDDDDDARNYESESDDESNNDFGKNKQKMIVSNDFGQLMNDETDEDDENGEQRPTNVAPDYEETEKQEGSIGGGIDFFGTNNQTIVWPKRGRAVLWPLVLNHDPYMRDMKTTYKVLPLVAPTPTKPTTTTAAQTPELYGVFIHLHQHDFVEAYKNDCAS